MCIRDREKELYDQVNEQIQQYWELDQQAINTGKVDMEEKRMPVSYTHLSRGKKISKTMILG